MLSVDITRLQGAFRLQAQFSSERKAGVTALTGPSGSGKSSVLHCIAGLARPDKGRIEVGGRVLFDSARKVDVPTHLRHIGVVFQESRLFPHMSVVRNLRYGERNVSGDGVDFDTVVELLGIGHLLDRMPGGLSGGERQRVAMGRALLTHPALLVMDEPLASLDAGRKDEILPFLGDLPQAFGVHVLYVTHSIDEVLRLADELVILEHGTVRARGTVAETARYLPGVDPADSFFEGVVGPPSEDGVLVVIGQHSLRVAAPRSIPVGARVRIRIPADDVLLATGPTEGLSVQNRIPGTITRITPLGASIDVEVDIGDQHQIVARVSPIARQQLGLTPGMAVAVLVKASALRIMGSFANRPAY